MVMDYKISGFSDEIDQDITKQFEHLNKLGISYFEPRGINGKNISVLNDDETEALAAAMDKYKIKVSSIGSPIGKIGIKDDFDSHMKLLAEVIKTAKRLGTKYIRVFSFYIPEGEAPEDYRDEVMKRMRAMTELAEQENVILLHENEKGIYGDIAPRCADILRTVNSPNLRAVFDPANFVQCGQVTYPEAYELIEPYLEYMHIKDALSDGSVVPAGMGEGHVGEILSSLAEKGYNGFLSLEPHLGSFTGLEALETGDDMTKLEKSSAEKFTVAYNALMKLLNKI